MMFGGGMILIWLIVIVGIFFLVRYMVDTNRNQTGPSKETPMSILERRYANGEIDREEFLKRKKDLSGS